MYRNISGKIKALAIVTFILGTIFSFISGIVVVEEDVDMLMFGFSLMAAGPVVAWLASCAVFGFAVIIDKLTQIEYNTRANQQKSNGVNALAAGAPSQPAAPVTVTQPATYSTFSQPASPVINSAPFVAPVTVPQPVAPVTVPQQQTFASQAFSTQPVTPVFNHTEPVLNAKNEKAVQPIESVTAKLPLEDNKQEKIDAVAETDKTVASANFNSQAFAPANAQPYMPVNNPQFGAPAVNVQPVAPVYANVQPSPDDIKRNSQVENLYEKGLISEEEYRWLKSKQNK